MNPLVKKILGFVVAIVILIALWAGLSWLVSSPAFPGPLAAIQQFIKEIPELWPHALISTWRILASMLLGTVLALPIGLFIGRSPKADAIVAPMLFLTYPIPKIVFLPVLMVLLGLGDASKIVLMTLIIFFQVVVTARDAAKSIPEASVLSVRSLGASKLQIATNVILPASLPELFTALRIGLGTAIAVLFVCESIASSSGLGYFITNAWGMIDYVSMFAGIIAMALLGAVFYELLDLLETRLTRWRKLSH